jgi:TrwC relaxase
VDGYAAPQLHTHSVIFNMTERADDSPRAIQPRSFFVSQQFATAVYQSELMYRLHNLGYEIQPGRSGAPEIKGYTQEYLDASSPRSQQIREYHAHRGPLQGLAIQIFQTGKATAGQEVRFHCPKTSFVAGLPVGMPYLVTKEAESVLAGEVGHLRHHHRIRSGSTQTGQVGVVDHADPGRIAPEAEGFVQETLHPEAIEAAIEAQIAALGVAQVDHAGDQVCRRVAELDLIGTGVMLHLFAGDIGHPLTALLRALLAKPELPHPAQHGGVGKLQAFFFHQLLVHTLHPAMAVSVEPPQ